MMCSLALSGFADDQIFYEPITVSGIALDSAGNPIAGAKIYIASVQNEQKLMGETETDANGKYQFVNVELPIAVPEESNISTNGVFEVFGQAKGYGFAWRGQRWYEPGDGDSVGQPDRENARHFAKGKPIIQDLHFDKPAPLSGQIVDDKDNPIANARIVLFNADPIPNAGFDKSRDFLVCSKDDFAALYLSKVIPSDMRETFSGEDGRFSFDQAPKNTGFRIFVHAPGFARRSLFASTAAKTKLRFSDTKVQYDGMKLVFSKVKPLSVSVVYGDSGKPAPNIFVECSSEAANGRGITNAKGKTQIRLPPGEYRVSYLAQFGTPYISRYSVNAILKCNVRSDAEAEFKIKLEPSGTVEVEIVDAHVGRPIEGADVWAHTEESNEYMWRSWKPPNISSFSRPRTNEHGKMKVFLMPGKYKIGAGYEFVPDKYEASAKGTDLTIKAGEVKSLKLKMKRRGVKD